MRRLAAAIGMAPALAVAVLLGTPGLVAAECPWLPPWPEATDAIRSAEQVIVGEVVSVEDATELGLGPDQEREMALRVTEVLRGPVQVGDLLDVQYLYPNWPWVMAQGVPPFPSCAYLWFEARWLVGESIVLALDAVHAPQRITENGYTWDQPRTVYNAMSVVGQHASISDFRRLAALPQTDAIDPTLVGSSQPGQPPSWLALAIGAAGAIVAWHRPGRTSRRSDRR
jgi:hypothetical protein